MADQMDQIRQRPQASGTRPPPGSTDRGLSQPVFMSMNPVDERLDRDGRAGERTTSSHERDEAGENRVRRCRPAREAVAREKDGRRESRAARQRPERGGTVARAKTFIAG